jgi:hypothetical protein
MEQARTSNEWLIFGSYTVLGYIALGIHRWIFAPGLEQVTSAVAILLVMTNLIAGSWCFIRALRAAWTISSREI